MATSTGDHQKLLDRLTQRDRRWIYALAAILVLLGLLILLASISFQFPNDIWSRFLSEIGVALIIAGLLMAGSERYLKESLFAEIEDNISATLESFRVTAFDLQQYQRLPPELRKGLRDRVLSAPVIQRDVTYEYCLSELTIDAIPAYKALVTSRSLYVNISAEQQRFDVTETLPSYSFSDNMLDYGFRKMTSKIKGQSEPPDVIVSQVIKNHVSETDPGPLIFRRSTTLDSGDELSVMFEGVAYLRSDDWISLEAFLPTIDMVCITSGQGLSFNGQPGNALIDIWDLKLEDGGKYRWILNGAILPGQGFDIWVEDDQQTTEQESI